MKLVHAKYGLEIDFQEGCPEILILENKLVMRELVGELWGQCSGTDGMFMFSDDKKILKIDKSVEMILNPFAIDFQNKKLMTALFSKMTMIGNEKILEKNEINSAIINILDDISNSINYAGISYRLEFMWQDLFKMYGIKIEKQGNFLLDIIEYMKAVSELCGISLLCFVNLKNYINNEELLDLYNAAMYNKVQLLLIESNQTDMVGAEHVTIIDNDLCLIQ